MSLRLVIVSPDFASVFSCSGPDDPVVDRTTLTCELTMPCPGDFDESGAVDFPDLLQVLSDWGPCAECAWDLDGSSAIDFPDLLQILSNWGPCPTTPG